ncbi:Scr1 family TA system antitoxin-like transcriptional regulator [Glycomyces sp. NPDC046736]|uniref:Scr1 family TA system antitoxin-like transcriptional regulator n=1 Tax=Glycomyces sp. NPDC046736 TaxID=3155615 RepID=UPI0033DB942E
MPLSKVAEWYYRSELVALAEETDLTYAQIASSLGVSVRTVQNYVSGETRPKMGMATRFAQICGAPEARVKFLEHVIQQLYTGGLVSEREKRSLFILERAEARSAKFLQWEPWFIPGPLQIRRYHLELLPEPSTNPELNWQRKHRRLMTIGGRNPMPTTRFLCSSNALQQTSGWDWAKEQFEHLLEINQWPNCEIRILDGLHYGAEHAFEIFLPGNLPEAPPEFVFVESIDETRHIEEAEKVQLYDMLFNSMWSAGRQIEGDLSDWIR